MSTELEQAHDRLIERRESNVERPAEPPKRAARINLKETHFDNIDQAYLALKSASLGNVVDDLEVESIQDDPREFERALREDPGAFSKVEDEKPSEEAEPEPTTDHAPQWSNDDLKVLGALQQQGQQIQQAAQQQLAVEAEFNKKYEGVNLNELEKTDTGRAALIRTDARELLERRNKILAAKQQLQGQWAEVQHNVKRREVVNGQRRLQAEFPFLKDDAKREAAIDWIVSKGEYTRKQIMSETNYDLVRFALRAYEAEQRADQPRKKVVVKHRKKARQPRVHTDFQGRPANLEELDKRFRNTGSIHDALALITAKRQAAQS